MVNTEDFIKRLEYLLDYYSLNASSFADKIRVQRSSISHLLSGRNKPSLDFIMKITDVFPDVNLYWMLNGKGSFLKNGSDEDAPAIAQTEPQHSPTSSENEFMPNLFETEIPVPEIENREVKTSLPIFDSVINSNSDIYKIVIFYKDGTFRDFSSRK
jgi:plasmid maintenance system antidote protein VapI